MKKMRISSNNIYWIIVFAFFCAASFFSYNVITLNLSSDDLKILSGQTVNVAKIIDGDKIAVKFNSKQFIVRLHGIKSFDASINIPQFQNIYRSSSEYLEKNILAKDIQLEFDTFKQDSKKRLLSYARHNNIDIGMDMIKKGISIVYTKYHFSKSKDYINVEEKARRNKAGLWGFKSTAQKAMQMKKSWAKERE